MGILTYQNVPLIVTLLLASILFIVVLVILLRANKAKKEEKAFIDQLNMARNSAIYDSSYQQEETAWQQWYNYWGKLLKDAEMVDSMQPNQSIGTALVAIPVVLWFLITIIAGNIGLGVIPGVVILFILKMVAENKVKAKQKRLEDQIPAFISALKSNVQANLTPERALIEAIDTTTAPLYDELKIAKNFAATASFGIALERLREETSSADIRFLCSCIELSSKLGANLEHQLEVIEAMIVERKELSRLLDAAIRENKPLMMVASGIIPFLFIYMYVVNEPTRDFWFVVPASWLVFLLVIILFGGAMTLSNKFIKELEEFR